MATLPYCLEFSVLLRLGALGHLLTATLLFMTDNKIKCYLFCCFKEVMLHFPMIFCTWW